jgi:hypothetical protein
LHIDDEIVVFNECGKKNNHYCDNAVYTMQKGYSHKLKKLKHKINNNVDLVEGSYSGYSD